MTWAVGRVGVCCCGPCASAGAGVRLRSVVRCPLPVPPPFVLLTVVLCVPGGAVLAALLLTFCCLWRLPCGVARPTPPALGAGFFFLRQVCAGCAPPPHPWRLVVLSGVVICRASCGVVLRSVVCFVLCFCVGCWAWLSSVVSWWVLVAPGVAFRWCAVVCPWVPCCAVLLPVVPPGVVWFRSALISAVVLVCPVAVRRPGVLCLLALCLVGSRCAVCLLLCCVAAWCCLRCALCRVRPGVSCCAFPVLSSLCGVAVGPCSPLVPCSPVLCPSSCAAVWSCGVPSCCFVWFVSCLFCSVHPRVTPGVLGLFPAFVWFLLLEKPLQSLLEYFFLSLKIKENYTLPNARTLAHLQAARPCLVHCLTCHPALVAVSWLACLGGCGVLDLTLRTVHLQRKGGESVEGGARVGGEGTW